MKYTVLPQARRSIDAIADYLLVEAGESVALRFVEEVESAFGYLAKWPSIGSPRRFRAARLGGIEIVDVVHAARDLPRALGDD